MNESLLTKRLQRAVGTAVVALVLVLLIWRSLDGISIGDVVLWVVLLVPVAFAVPGLRTGRRKTYAWMTMAITPYLVVAVTEAVANPAQRLWATLCLFVAFGLFVLLIAYLRVSGREVSPSPELP